MWSVGAFVTVLFWAAHLLTPWSWALGVFPDYVCRWHKQVSTFITTVMQRYPCRGLYCSPRLSRIIHRLGKDICRSFSVVSDVGHRPSTAGYSDLGQSEEGTLLRGDNPLWTAARGRLKRGSHTGKKLNLPLATSPSLLGYVRKRGSC